MADKGSLEGVVVIRRELGLSQAALADLLGISPRTVQSWEQGWRRPSNALEKLLLLLVMTWRQGDRLGSQVCWEVLDCREDDREQCLAYRSRQGHLCWFLSGNVCRGVHMRTWRDKKRLCEECTFFHILFQGDSPL